MAATVSTAVCIPAGPECLPIDDIAITACVGDGAFSHVYKGKGNTTDGPSRDLALKCVAADKEADGWLFNQASLIHEWRIMASLGKHRNIIAAYGLCIVPPAKFKSARAPLSQHGATALVMELGQGGNLVTKIYKHHISAGRNTYSFKQALAWALDIAAAIAYLHGLSDPVIHRDLKIENVLLCYDPELGREVAKLCDFGLSAHIHAETCSVHVASRMALTTKSSLPRTATALQRLVTSDEAMVKDPLTPSYSNFSFSTELSVRRTSGASGQDQQPTEVGGAHMAYALPRSRNQSVHGMPFTISKAFPEIPVDLQTSLQNSADAKTAIQDLISVAKLASQEASPNARRSSASEGPSPAVTSVQIFQDVEEFDNFDMQRDSSSFSGNRRFQLRSLSRLSDVSERPTECANATQHTVEITQAPIWDAQDYALLQPRIPQRASGSESASAADAQDDAADSSDDSVTLNVPTIVFGSATGRPQGDGVAHAQHAGAVHGRNAADAVPEPYKLKLSSSEIRGSNDHCDAASSSSRSASEPVGPEAELRSQSAQRSDATPAYPTAPNRVATVRFADRDSSSPESLPSTASRSAPQGMSEVFKKLARTADSSTQQQSSQLAPAPSRADSLCSSPSKLSPASSRFTRAVGKLLARRHQSRVHDRVVWRMTGGTGSLAYMAPEVLAGRAYNAKIDVFSFSVMLWEIFSKTQVINKYDSAEALQSWTTRVALGDRLSFPAFMPPGLCELITAGWAQNPEDRPTAADYLERLEAWSQSEECETFITRGRNGGLFSCLSCAS